MDETQTMRCSAFRFRAILVILETKDWQRNLRRRAASRFQCGVDLVIGIHHVGSYFEELSWGLYQKHLDVREQAPYVGMSIRNLYGLHATMYILNSFPVVQVDVSILCPCTWKIRESQPVILHVDRTVK